MRVRADRDLDRRAGLSKFAQDGGADRLLARSLGYLIALGLERSDQRQGVLGRKGGAHFGQPHSRRRWRTTVLNEIIRPYRSPRMRSISRPAAPCAMSASIRATWGESPTLQRLLGAYSASSAAASSAALTPARCRGSRPPVW